MNNRLGGQDMKVQFEDIKISYIGFSDYDITAVKHDWESDPRTFGRWLVAEHPTLKDAEALVNGGITMIVGDQKTFRSVDQYGEVIDSRLSYDDRHHDPEVNYLYLHMKGQWHVSDNGIDWETIEDQIAYEEKQKQKKEVA